MANAANNPATGANSAETGFPIVQWYGERGIVNSIVTHITTPVSDVVRKTTRLLEAIKWCNGSGPQWLNDIHSATYIVEMGLADFGDPDLMVVVRTNSDEHPRLIFVEAKVSTYREKMMNNTDGMAASSFNSSINGQLSLKYRFAKALESGPWSRVPDCIEEPSAIFTSYQAYLQDNNEKPRKLEKDVNIREILYGQRLIGLPEENVYYVALTWDDDQHIFFEDPLITAKETDLLPVFLDEHGHRIPVGQWTRIGWLGYHELENNFHDLKDKSSQYAAAQRTMRTANKPDAYYYEAAELKQLNRWPRTIQEKSNLIQQKIAEKGYTVTKCKGSYSVLDSSQTVVAKIIPHRAGVFVGIQDSYAEKLSAKQAKMALRVRNSRFIGTLVTPSENADGTVNWLAGLL